MTGIIDLAVTGADVGAGEQLAAGTVTLLLADVNGPVGLRETEPEAMVAASALEAILGEGGHRPPRCAADRT